MNSRGLRVFLMALVSAAGGATRPALADFNVHQVQTQMSAHAVEVSARLDLALSSKAEAALGKGIPLSVVINIALLEHRSILWDRTIATWDLHRSLRFHALSDEYLVGGAGMGPDSYENFSSLSDALNYLGKIVDLHLPFDGSNLAGGDLDYRVRMRVYLDIGSLPFPMRPVAYASPSWHLNSGWTTWSVQP